jgi:hypothetical protein
MTNLLQQHPSVALCHVDASVVFVRNLEDYLDEFSAGTHWFVMFRKVSGGLDAKSHRLITSVAPLLDKKIGYASVNDLVQSVVGGKATMTPIPALPVISTQKNWKKPNVPSDSARPNRDIARRHRSSSLLSRSATFTANDGLAEG